MQKWVSQFRLLAVAFGLLLLMQASVGYAQVTQADINEAKLRAELAELQKKEAAARKDAADSEASLANAAQTAKNTLAKSEADLEKAKADAQKSLSDLAKSMALTVPDTAKYPLPATSAPVVAATTAHQTFVDADRLAQDIANRVLSSLPPSTKPLTTISILADDEKLHTLIGLSRALRISLDVWTERIRNVGAQLRDKAAQKPEATAPAVFYAKSMLPLISSIGETVLAYAKILKTQYAFASTSHSTLATTILRANVSAALIMTRPTDIQLIDADAIIALIDSPSPYAEMTLLTSLQTEIRNLRSDVLLSSARADQLRKDAPKPKDDNDKAASTTRAAYIRLADEIDARAKAATAMAEEVDKSLDSLYVADQKGVTPIEASLRGGILNDKIKSGNIYTLAVSAAASDADIVASDGLFRGYRVSVASNTVGQWRLTSGDGVIKSIGAIQLQSDLVRVRLTN